MLILHSLTHSLKSPFLMLHRSFFTLALAALLAGCEPTPPPPPGPPNTAARVETTNPAVPAVLLFEVDGCKVYRFQDGVHYDHHEVGYLPTYVYFTTVPGRVTVPATVKTSRSGKHSKRHQVRPEILNLMQSN